jgi:hypothetical protein
MDCGGKFVQASVLSVSAAASLYGCWPWHFLHGYDALKLVIYRFLAGTDNATYRPHLLN